MIFVSGRLDDKKQECGYEKNNLKQKQMVFTEPIGNAKTKVMPQ